MSAAVDKRGVSAAAEQYRLALSDVEDSRLEAVRAAGHLAEEHREDERAPGGSGAHRAVPISLRREAPYQEKDVPERERAEVVRVARVDYREGYVAEQMRVGAESEHRERHDASESVCGGCRHEREKSTQKSADERHRNEKRRENVCKDAKKRYAPEGVGDKRRGVHRGDRRHRGGGGDCVPQPREEAVLRREKSAQTL